MSQRPCVRPVEPAAGPTLRLWADEIWSFVRSKKGQRWRWWVEDENTGRVVAFVFGRRTHVTFGRLLALLQGAGWVIGQWLTAAWSAYATCLPAALH